MQEGWKRWNQGLRSTVDVREQVACGLTEMAEKCLSPEIIDQAGPTNALANYLPHAGEVAQMSISHFDFWILPYTL